MKNLNDILINWDNLDIDDSELLKVSDIKNQMRNYQLVYTLDKPGQIKIFDYDFHYFDKFKDKVYINGKHAELNEEGFTVRKYKSGEYHVYIDGFDELNEIGGYAFYNCITLTSITIPNSVKAIGFCVFYRCKNLKTVYVEDIDKFNEIKCAGTSSDPTCYGAKLIELNK